MAIKVIFHRVVQNVPEFDSTDVRSVSRVYFDLEVDGEMFSDLYVNVEELAGGSHATEGIRVGELKATLLPVDQEAFKQAVRGYYQSLVASADFGKHLAKYKGFRTYENELGMEQVVEL